MTKKIVGLAAALLMAQLIVSPNAAAASAEEEPVSASIATTRDADVLWAQADVAGEGIETVSVKIFAPAVKGDRKVLWQSCKLPFSGPGRYVCGIDVSDDSMASERPGRWTARVDLDGSPADSVRFRI